MKIILLVFIFFLGASIGSFLSVVIYRTRNSKKGILISRSICISCNKEIKWKHLIPIFSWIFLKGKCAYCGKKISKYYFLIELFTGLLFLFTFMQFNFLETIPSSINNDILNYIIDYEVLKIFFYYLFIFSLLTVIFFYDSLYQEIPDRFSIPAIILAFTANIIIFKSPGINDMLLGSSIIFSFFLIQYLISKGTWLGGGDLRIGVLMGIMLGFAKGLLALVVSYFAGFLFAIYLLSKGKAGRKTKIAFGPFLIIGIIVSIFYGNELLEWYLNDFLI